MTQGTSFSIPTFIFAILIAVPQLSETIYIPSLPDMAKDFGILEAYTEYTLTTYLLGFAVGVFIWGAWSDYYGRKKGLILGLLIYIASSFACWLAKDITTLYILRFLQAFGISVGSVLGQAIMRDAVKPEDRGRVHSMISMVMAFAPAIGPFIGSLVIYKFHWSAVFLVLVIFGCLILAIIGKYLPETNRNLIQNRFSLTIYKDCALTMISNKRVWGFSILIGLINGIIFGYFAESPFYFVELLGLSKTTFGTMALYICIPIFIGGMVSRGLNKRHISPDKIIWYGIMITVFTGIVFFVVTKLNIITIAATMPSVTIALLLISMVMLGNAIIIPNCFSQALEPFSKFTGTAASLFGFTYYIFISLLTGLMGWMHNGTLYTLPLFIVLSGMCMLLSYTIFIKK